jgi:hypothetical protein
MQGIKQVIYIIQINMPVIMQLTL